MNKLVLAAIGVVCALLLSVSTASAQQAFPGCQGDFGCDTRHAFSLMPGTQPTICYLTSLSNSGNGTLRAILTGTNDCATSGPRIMICEVSGYIDLSSAIEINDPYLLIDASSCPSPGISYRYDYIYCIGTGGGAGRDCHDMLMKHMRGRITDDNGSTPASGRGCINVEGAAYNVVYDHNSCAWHTDDAMMVYNITTHDVTMSNNLVAEGLNYDAGTMGSCAFAATGDASGSHANILYFRNICASNSKVDREGPGAWQQTEYAWVNNLVYNWDGPRGSLIQGTADNGPDNNNTFVAAYVSSVWKGGPQTDNPSAAISFRGTASPAPITSGKLYKSGNSVSGTGVTEYETWAGNTFDPLVGTPPTELDGILSSLTILSASNVLSTLTATSGSGARPANRDSLDTRIASEINNGTGSLKTINTWGEGSSGTFPTLANNCIDYNTANHDTACANSPNQMPASPFADDDSDGYYNIEEWIFERDCEVGETDLCVNGDRVRLR